MNNLEVKGGPRPLKSTYLVFTSECFALGMIYFFFSYIRNKRLYLKILNIQINIDIEKCVKVKSDLKSSQMLIKY